MLPQVVLVIILYLAIGFFALVNGILASLFIHRIHTAYWAALVFPITLLVFLLMLVNIDVDPSRLGQEIDDGVGFIWIVGFPLLWAIVGLSVTLFKFKRLEV